MSLFLSARWEHLILINYEIAPPILTPFLPKGTELDLWQGKAFVSLVGFMFLDTHVYRFSFPFHKNFEEVNLRFYVKCGEKRGVAFIKEIVPRRAIAYLARKLYNENYVPLPMSHSIKSSSVEYQWYQQRWQKISVTYEGFPQHFLPGSEAEFIIEHYWGYSKHRNGKTMEYEVKHPPWRIWEASDFIVDIDAEALYGKAFSHYLNKPPTSVFLAEGSPVQVFKGTIF